jgi:hypothetical protein
MTASLTALLILALLPMFTLRHYGNKGFPQETEKAGTIRTFPWSVSSPIPSLDGLTASLFYKPYRIYGEVEDAKNHYLWSKKRSFSTAEEIAQNVRDTVPEGHSITGASTLAPLIALLSGRTMAGDEVDTNSKVFKTGMRSEREFWKMACADRVEVVVSATRSFFDPRRLQKRMFPCIRDARCKIVDRLKTDLPYREVVAARCKAERDELCRFLRRMQTEAKFTEQVERECATILKQNLDCAFFSGLRRSTRYKDPHLKHGFDYPITLYRYEPLPHTKSCWPQD